MYTLCSDQVFQDEYYSFHHPDICLIDLPQGVLSKILSNLCIHDIYNIRLTCVELYEVSFLREVVSSFKIVVKTVKNDEVQQLLAFFEKIHYGRFSWVSILCKNLKEGTAELLLTKLKNVTFLTFDMKYTYLISKHCPYIQELVWMQFFQNVKGVSNKVLLEQCFYLNRLNMLEDLTIQGDETYFEYPRIPASIVDYVVENAPGLVSLSFSHIFMLQDESIIFDELEIKDSHVKKWSFRYVYVDGNFFIKVPATITSLHCSIADDVRWNSRDCSFVSLSLDGSTLPRQWNDKDYLELEHLILSRVKFLSTYPPVCKHLKALTLRDCSHSLVYLKLLGAFSDAMKKLTLDACSDHTSVFGQLENIRNNEIKMILSVLVKLEVLELIGLHYITPLLLDEIRSTQLREIIFDNCKYLSTQSVLRRHWPFKVTIKNKCCCIKK